jgi:hypothetical protein
VSPPQPLRGGEGALGRRGGRPRPSRTRVQEGGWRGREGIPDAGGERVERSRRTKGADGRRPRHRTEVHPHHQTVGHLATEGTTRQRLRSGGVTHALARCARPSPTPWPVLTDKDVSLYNPQVYGPHTFFTTGFPRFLSIRGARGLQAFDQQQHTSY